MSYYSDAVLALTPSLYWRLNETASTMTDSSGNARHGTVNGNPTRGVAGALPSTDTDLAVDLDGSGDYISQTYNPFTNSTARTLTGWFNRDGTGRDACFGYSSGPLLEIASPTDPNTDDVIFAPDFDTTRSVWTHAWPGSSQWVFVALVFTQGGGANNLELYINGVSAGLKTNAGSYGASKQFRAGTWNIGTMDFDGKMDEVAVFESALSGANIAALYTAGKTAQILPPIGGATAAGLVPAPAASSTIEPPIASAAASALAPAVSPEPSRITTTAIKERPPDEAALYVENPDGSERRIAGDEPSLPLADYTIASTLPGGFSTADGDAMLPRQGIETLQKFSRVSVRHSDRTPLWEGRLESTPQRSEDGTLGIAAVGHQALLLDNPGIVFLGVDNDMTAWEDPPGDYLDSQAAASHSVNSRFTLSTGENVLSIGMDAEVNVASSAYGVAWYLPPMGQVIGTTIQYIAQEVGGTNMALTMATSSLREDISTLTSATVDTSGTTVKTFTSTTGGLAARVRDTPTTNPVNKTVRIANFYAISVFGNHGLPMRDVSSTLPQGLYLSDIVPYLLAQYAPLLATTKGGESTIESSTYAMASAVWRDPTTLGQIIEDGLAFEPDRDWAVWEGPTFHMGSHQSIGRTWTVRRSEGATFHDLGETSEPDYNGVVVTYTDGDGSTKRVGPPGSGADTEDASLADTDPENPVNASSVLSNRYKLIDLGDSTSAAAISVGQVALSEALRQRFSGEVELPRYALREGQILPTNMMRAGDRIIDGDSLTGEEMLLVEASYQRSAVRPMRATVDTPANRLDSEIARIAGRPRKLNRRKVRRFHHRAKRARRRARHTANVGR